MITINELADEAGVHAQTIRRWIKRGYIRITIKKDARGRAAVEEGDEEKVTQFLELWSALQLVFPKPATWLDAKNAWLGDRTPRELIGTDDEYRVREILGSIMCGMTS